MDRPDTQAARGSRDRGALGEQAAAGRAQAQSPRLRGRRPKARLGLLSHSPAPASAGSLVPRSTRWAWPVGRLSHARSGFAGIGKTPGLAFAMDT